MGSKRLVIPILILTSLVIAGLGILALQPRGLNFQARYFAETGALVREPFLTFFDEQGGVEFFGYPLTDAYTDADGTLVQTFEHAHIQLSVTGVELAPIGTELFFTQPDAGLVVDPAFETYYLELGGAAFSGLPISQARLENGMLVQDFENLRLVQNQSGGITLADLGTAYLAVHPPPDHSGQAALRLRGTPLPPDNIRASVSVDQSTVRQDDQQTIYLYVYSTDGESVAGARSVAVLHFDGVTAEVELTPTNEYGLASATFLTPSATVGSQVFVRMYVLVGETLLTVETSYFQWW